MTTPDPARAAEDARAVLAELHGFCDAPRTPPTGEALRLCEYAKELPDCEGFRAQCAKYLEPPPISEPPAWLQAIGRVIAAIAPYLGWAVLVVGVAAVLFLVGREIVRRFTNDEPEEEPPRSASVSLLPPPEATPVETGTPDAILARAEAALARGDLRAALFGFLHASLRALDVRGAIRIARDRTNGEYVRSCGDERARPNLRELVFEVDVVQFGGREPEFERVRRAGQLANVLVRAAALGALVLALVGCKGAERLNVKLPRATDPAGFEVAPALLKRQGYTIKEIGKPLARLQEPKDEPLPPLLIDVERTELDTDAVEGLERWVKGGGFLVLFGSPWRWPTEFHATGDTGSGARDVIVEAALAAVECDDPNDSECEAKTEAAFARRDAQTATAHLAQEASFHWVEQEGQPVARQIGGKGAVYAAIGKFGSGTVLAVASSDLLTNVGLAREGNAAALITLLTHVRGTELLVVGEHDGVTPVGDPLSALIKAGLGLPIAHALVLLLLLALAVGLRRRGPRPVPPPARRAFVEHVEATGALYAHAKASPHALASYGRFVTERLRTRLAKGGDLATVLAQRSGAPREECQRVLDRATMIKAGDARQGDELAVLRELADLYARAADPMTPSSRPRRP